MSQEIVWDFTQPEKIEQLARWTDANFLKATTNGLGWDGEANASRDVTIESREATATGWSWHPLTAVSISAEVIPAGQFTFINDNSISFPTTAGSLYVRYSPDSLHWSTWQALHLQEPRDRQKPRLFFAGTVRVPERAREQYAKLLQEFAGTTRPVPINEEEAVHWILKERHDYFEHELPFIGYVEFLWKTHIKGNQRLKRLQVSLSYGRGGKGGIPAGVDETGHWRFKAVIPKKGSI